MTYDAFKPKFPLDPFSSSSRTRSGTANAHGDKTTGAVGARPPWSIDTDILPSMTPFLQQERRVILILGRALSNFSFLLLVNLLLISTWHVFVMPY